MAAPWAGHYILPLWCLSSFFLLCFFAHSKQSQIACQQFFHTWCGLSTNLECMSEMCCRRLAENTGRKNSPKKFAIWAPSHNFVSSQRRHVSTIGKKLLNSNISSTHLHNMVNFGPLTDEIGWLLGEFGAPQQISTFFSSWLRYCTDVAQRSSTKLCTMFGRLLGWYTIYCTFSWALAL